MDIEAVRLEGGESIRHGVEPLAHGVEVIEYFLRTEIPEVVGAEFVAEEAGADVIDR
jgi:hypothetical protein